RAGPLLGRAMCGSRLHQFLRPAKSGRGAVSVGTLADALWNRSEWIGSGDVVAVAVCRDHSDHVAPCERSVGVLRRTPECSDPGCTLVDGAFRQRGGASLDQRTSLIECLPVLEIHGPCYCWGQTCDEVRLGPATSGSLG